MVGFGVFVLMGVVLFMWLLCLGCVFALGLRFVAVFWCLGFDAWVCF